MRISTLKLLWGSSGQVWLSPLRRPRQARSGDGKSSFWMSEWEVMWETEEEDGESGTVTVASIYPPTLAVVPGPQPPASLPP